ncbi:PREDICTED: MLO-like protein 5 [Nicotiana attenuata]|nr:PREDICTED: MLO-like protein 5 [Nicotiana attenuata]
MRHGFISVHLAPGSKFNFQKYIKRSLEDDFKIVVGINSLLWFSAVVYLLMNVHGWQAMFWLSILPLVIILAVGTKLQAIIAQMALEIQERHAVVQGIPLVQVSDRHFWFGKPKLILHLVHLTLFQNAFEITYFLWISYEFGLHSCFHDNFYLALLRVAIGLGVQILCSYITLPLYALVTQMGSTMKRSIFDDQTSKALMNWHKNAKKKKPTKPGPVETRKLGSPGDSPEISPITKGGHQSRIEMSNVEPSSSSQTANIVASVDIPEEIPHNDGRSRSTNPDLLTGP